ncbi:unnamed protein product [Chrysoparadoxa australica]
MFASILFLPFFFSSCLAFYTTPGNPRGEPSQSKRLLSSNKIVKLQRPFVVKPLDMSEGAAEEAKRLMEQAAKIRAEAAELSEAAGIKKAEVVKPQVAEAEEEAYKPRELSETMKNKLRREMISQGADPNRSSGNPILIISAVVALLVILGGKGIFYGYVGAFGLDDLLLEFAKGQLASIRASPSSLLIVAPCEHRSQELCKLHCLLEAGAGGFLL